MHKETSPSASNSTRAQQAEEKPTKVAIFNLEREPVDPKQLALTMIATISLICEEGRASKAHERKSSIAHPVRMLEG
jgi:hypothetical protein